MLCASSPAKDADIVMKVLTQPPVISFTHAWRNEQPERWLLCIRQGTRQNAPKIVDSRPLSRSRVYYSRYQYGFCNYQVSHRFNGLDTLSPTCRFYVVAGFISSASRRVLFVPVPDGPIIDGLRYSRGGGGGCDCVNWTRATWACVGGRLGKAAGF